MTRLRHDYDDTTTTRLRYDYDTTMTLRRCNIAIYSRLLIYSNIKDVLFGEWLVKR